MTDSIHHSSEEFHAVAAAVADAARKAILPHFRGADLGTESKREDFDPVTVADRAAEVAMRAVLAELRPDDAILGEEFDDRAGTSGLTWILDPIDGTRSFICGTPTWGVLVALADSGGPRLGVIDQPYVGERFTGGLGRADVDGPLGRRALGVSRARGLEDALMLSTFPEVGTEAERAAFDRVRAEVRLTRYGTDCYGYALLAAGQVDLVIEAGLKPYDIAAPLAVVEAAGGIVTDWQGGSAAGGGQVIAAATPELHAAALERLNAAS